MITWQVWRAIKQPPRTHRLFRLTLDEVRASQPAIPQNILITGIVFLTIAAFLSREFSSFLSIFILLAIPLTAINFVLTGSIYGLVWAFRSGQTIARLRRTGLYDLLCLTPPGPLNINWAVCVSVLYKSIGTSPVDTSALWPARMFLILPLVVYQSIQQDVADRPWLLVLVMGVYLALFIFWFYIEDVQSTILGGTLGLVIPVHTQDRFEVNVGTIVSYIGLQLLIYMLVILLYILLRRLFDTYILTGWLTNLGLPALALLALYFIREGVLRLLWRHLAYQLNAGPEVSLLMGYRVY